VDLSGIIFVVLALAWAVYLIPKALKHHDELARTRSIDKFSTAMRVLARREPVSRGDARLVVTPRRTTTRMLVPTTAASRQDAVEVTVQDPVTVTGASAASGLPGRADSRPDSAAGTSSRTPAQTPSRRAAARAAARRRRHILVGLLLADVAIVTVAAFGLLPWWSVAWPALLTVGFLALCRHHVRRAASVAGSSRTTDVVIEVEADARPDTVARPAVRVDAPYGMPLAAPVRIRSDQAVEEVSADEDTVAISSVAVAAAVAAASVEEADEAARRATQVETVAASAPATPQGSAQGTAGSSLWDPLPMTLPTYVTKPRATRTVRTIDLTAPGTWSSGHSEEDSKLVEESQAATEDAADEAGAEQRAVGS